MISSILDVPVSQLKTDYIRIENLDQYKFGIDTIHPESPKYLNYWRRIKKLLVEGMWGEEFGGYRFCTGSLLFYANLGLIEDTDENKITVYIKPLIRDLEWELSYEFLEAEGFSGFYLDEEYTSDSLIFDYNKPFPTTFREKQLYNSKGELKKYITPRENIRRIHEYPKGQCLYLNQAKNVSILGSRGGGKSYFVALAKMLHYLIIDGGKYYNEKTGKFYKTPEYNKSDILSPTVVMAAGSGDTDKSSEMLAKLEANMNALAKRKDFGVWGEVGDDDYTPCPLYKDMTGSLSPGNKKNPYIHEYKVLQKGREVKKGSRAKVYHVSYSANKKAGSQAGAGGRYTISVIEESGLTGNTIDIQNSNTSAVSRNGVQFGVQTTLGTSGNMKMIEQTRKLFLNPQDYNVIAHDDVWEGNGKNGKIGFFLPYYLTLNQFKDINGNTDFNACFKYIHKSRELFAQSDDPSVLREEKMNRPIIPSEMWITTDGHYLPYEEAMNREKELLKGNLYKKLGTPVKLSWNSKSYSGVSHRVDTTIEPFYDLHNTTRLSYAGGIIIYQFPKEFEKDDRYVFTYDPYVSDDLSPGGSLGCVHVWINPKYWDDTINTTTGVLVATYIGKHPNGLDGYHEELEKLVAFYGNCNEAIHFEDNRGRSCRDYFVKKNKQRLLGLKPGTTQTTDKYSKRTVKYGITIGNKVVKIQYLDRLSDLLKSDIIEGIKFIETLPCIFTVRQIAAYKIDGNFDTISSLMLLPIVKDEIVIKEELKLLNKHKHNPLTFITNNSKLWKKRN